MRLNPTQFLQLTYVTILGLVIRLCGLNGECLWWDEFITLVQSTTYASIEDLVLTVSQVDPHPPGYYVLMYIWVKIFGASDTVLRGFSALTGTLAIPLIYLLANRLFPGPGPKPMFAGLWLALSPMHFWYSQEARNYSLIITMMLTALLFMSFAFPADDTRTKKTADNGMKTVDHNPCSLWLLPCSILTASLLYFHYYTAVFGLAVGLVMIFMFIINRGMIRWTSLLCALILTFAAIDQGGNFWVNHNVEEDVISWMPKSYGPDLLIRVLRAQWLGPYFNPMPITMQFIGMISGVILFAFGLKRAWSLSCLSTRFSCTIAIPLVFVFCLPVLVSYIKPVVFWGDRFLCLALPFTTIVMAMGMPEQRGRLHIVQWLLVGFLFACQGCYLAECYTHRQKRTWDLAAEYLMKHGGGKPVVYVNPPGAERQFDRYSGLSINTRRFDFSDMTELQSMVDGSASPVYLLSYKPMDKLFLSQGLDASIQITLFPTRRNGHDLCLHRISPKSKLSL